MKGRILACILFSAIFLFNLYMYFELLKVRTFDINRTRINSTDFYCLYECRIKNWNNSRVRVIVTHSGWASIVDRYVNSESFILKLPKRDVTYVLRTVHEKNGKIYVGRALLIC